MRVIDIKKDRAAVAAGGAVQQRITMLDYGHTGSGKTEFAATWPRPVFLGENSESGWTTITSMPEEKFFEPGVVPIVWGIEEPKDMIECLTQKLPAAVKAGQCKTVVIDSLTFYGDLFLAFLEEQAKSNPKEQGLAVFGKYLKHIRHLMSTMHQLPVNILWLCLAKEPGEGEQQGGIMLTGQSAKIAPARCDYFMYQRAYRETIDSPIKFGLYPRGYGTWPGRARDGGQLPDVITDVTYKGFMAALQAKKSQPAQGAQAPANGQQQPAPAAPAT